MAKSGPILNRLLLAGLAAVAIGGMLAAGGCSPSPVGTASEPVAAAVPVVRIRVVERVESASIAATSPATIRVGSATPQRIALPSDQPVQIRRNPSGWQLGTLQLPPGVVAITPDVDGTVKVQNVGYRGSFRLIPSGEDLKFDVVNDLPIESYLRGVLSKEVLADWNPETYRAQAIVARTYALYESRNRDPDAPSHFDLYADQRSQVYGGIPAETAKADDAVNVTRGIVVAHGPPGQERIFKSYFSSCCGGVSQAAVDAFGASEPMIPPLLDQSVGGLCRISPRFNWGPIVVPKDELTRRFRLFGQRRVADRPAEAQMGPVTRIDIQRSNRFGRPTRFLVTDALGNRFSWSGEELRWAVNTDAKDNQVLLSSYIKIINDAETVRFVEGHGWGHGVGMCQWCSEARARSGMRAEDIVVAAFPRSTLVRAY